MGVGNQGSSVLRAALRQDDVDVVSICDAQNNEFARGTSNYNSDDVRRIRGLKTGEIAEALGHCPYQAVIHRDNMTMTR